jgi:hypothetical protein
VKIRTVFVQPGLTKWVNSIIIIMTIVAIFRVIAHSALQIMTFIADRLFRLEIVMGCCAVIPV